MQYGCTVLCMLLTRLCWCQRALPSIQIMAECHRMHRAQHASDCEDAGGRCSRSWQRQMCPLTRGWLLPLTVTQSIWRTCTCSQAGSKGGRGGGGALLRVESLSLWSRPKAMLTVSLAIRADAERTLDTTAVANIVTKLFAAPLLSSVRSHAMPGPPSVNLMPARGRYPARCTTPLPHAHI